MKTNCHNVFGTALAVAIALAGMAIQTAAAQVADQPVCCHIAGEVIGDPECHRLLLTRYNADLRVNSCDTIEVDANGRFTYDLRTRECDMYTIIAENEYVSGRWYSTDFFAENGAVNIRRYAFSTKRRPEMTADGPINSEMLQMEKKKMEMFFNAPAKELRMLEESGRQLTPEAQRLVKLMAEAKTEDERSAIEQQCRALDEAGKAETPEYIAARKRYGQAAAKSRDYTLRYAKDHPTLLGLYYLCQVAKSSQGAGGDLAERVAAIYDSLYVGRFRDSGLSRIMGNWLAQRNIKPGGRFIDFTAPDLQGNSHRLSEEISGRIALIDLWASWCGPCRRNSKAMMPVYEEFRDRGFTVVGVAREREAENMRKAIEQDGYRWLNLLELNDRAMIWERYGCGNGGGKTVLVDRDGTILAVNPKADEVREVLSRKL
ncbi:MAG: AhpC/TSA family protein [Paraprevotella sp.]|nr:AhpC/TSA family protein [Paraprevotella sp.]MBP3473223.1 AhpC/TSA family protein [Paraprevotella sp.]